MEQTRTYDDFPVPMVLLAVVVTLSLYALGAIILSGFGPGMTLLYLLFIVGNEVHVMKKSCVDCFYYGRWCAFGRGKLAALIFRKGEPGRFIAKKIGWVDLLPDMLVLLIPLGGGIALLVQGFSWGLALLLAALLGLALGGNYVVRSQVACKYCRQSELGCPAERLFSGH